MRQWGACVIVMLVAVLACQAAAARGHRVERLLQDVGVLVASGEPQDQLPAGADDPRGTLS